VATGGRGGDAGGRGWADCSGGYAKRTISWEAGKVRAMAERGCAGEGRRAALEAALEKQGGDLAQVPV
jgi:hypothetical protein